MSETYAPKVFVPEGMVAEQNAVDQLAMCLADERAVAGALMADHHLGSLDSPSAASWPTTALCLRPVSASTSRAETRPS